MHLGPFQEFLASDHGVEFSGIDKMVFPAALLTGTRRARREGNREMNSTLMLEQQSNQRGFAGTGGCGDNVEISNHGVLSAIRISRHSFYPWQKSAHASNR
jgi:hypothetical protein